MAQQLRKAVFPVAGLGSRFLPATKASPKEMLPVVDKPLIQYAVEEAAAAGITDLIFITGRNKRAIEDHFDTAYELESVLAAQGKRALLDAVQGVLPAGCRCIYIRQAEPLGLGHAVLCAQPVVGDEPFAVVLADDLIDARPPVLAQMAQRFAAERCSILGVEEIARAHTGSYGIVSPERSGAELSAINAIVEKPAPAQAPSTLAVVGRYILTPKVFDKLAAVKPGRVVEQQLRVGTRQHAEHAPARGLRLGRGDAHLLADEPVEERRLADVRTADDRDVASAEFPGLRHYRLPSS